MRLLGSTNGQPNLTVSCGCQRCWDPLCRSANLLYRAFQTWSLSTPVKLTRPMLDGNTSRSGMFHCTLFVNQLVFKMLCNELRNLDAYWLLGGRIIGGLECDPTIVQTLRKRVLVRPYAPFSFFSCQFSSIPRTTLATSESLSRNWAQVPLKIRLSISSLAMLGYQGRVILVS